jgi:hypothetical protein
MWVWARKVATAAPTGNAHISPHHMDQTSRISSPKGSVVMKQFHGSRAKSAPNVRSSRAQPMSVSSISGVPPRRRATTPMPAIDAPLIASAPRLMPTARPPVSQ